MFEHRLPRHILRGQNFGHGAAPQSVTGGALWVAAALILPVAIGCGGAGRRAPVKPQAMPSAGTFTGVYFSPQYGRMDMVQNGRAVVGTYVKDDRSGRIEGTAVGNLLRFEWTEQRELISGHPIETRGRGYFKYVADEDDSHKLLGEWGHDERETGGGPWNAVKSKRLKPSSMAPEDEAGTGDSAFDNAPSADDEVPDSGASEGPGDGEGDPLGDDTLF